MQLFKKQDIDSKLKKENQELIDLNIRLKRQHRELISKLNTIKDSYDPDKIARLQEYEKFLNDTRLKEQVKLKELKELDEAITNKKDIYYGLIEKQDELDEKNYQINEKEKKLTLRENFVLDLERRWQEKQK